MPKLTTLSTFRPPPFVSDSRFPGPGIALPTSLSRTDTSHPASSLAAAVIRINSSLENVTDHDGAFWWNMTGVNQTTPSGVGAGTSPEPYFPAGYPSGYTWAHIVCASVVVTIVILVIVFGNFLVMWAIVTDRNLKGTQNLFIGSLALADFLLGLLVVPFSLAYELMGFWYFGTVFCELWKATDVLLCTASITSLCLISLDRYWSITKAVHYSRQRTTKRAAVMIFIVWFVSAAICIPPLIGWKQPAPDSDWPLCALSEDIGYVLYSSMGSFYIPAFIMVFVYFKIYQAAKARARKNVSKAPRGALSEKSEQKNSTESSGTEQQCSQYMHHQQRVQEQQQQQKEEEVKPKEPDPVQPSTPEKPQVKTPSAEVLKTAASECRCTNDMAGDSSWTQGPTSEDEGSKSCGEFRSRSQSLPCSGLRIDEMAKLLPTDSDSCDALAGPALNLLDRGRFGLYSSMPTTTTDTDSSLTDITCYLHQHQQQHQQQPASKNKTHHGTFSQSPAITQSNAVTNSPEEAVSQAGQDNGSIQQFKIMEPKQNGNVDRNKTSPQRAKDSHSSCCFGGIGRCLFCRNRGKVEGSGDHCLDKKKKKKGHRKEANDDSSSKHPDFFSAERQKRKIAKARERRATLVLGLVMAAFILCWLPFFALYVVSAFCVGCIPPMVFTVFFWIGYCNSALNPIIYTVFNRDFRRAFHRILCGRKRGRR